jgi:hypothetical protein
MPNMRGGEPGRVRRGCNPASRARGCALERGGTWGEPRWGARFSAPIGEVVCARRQTAQVPPFSRRPSYPPAMAPMIRNGSVPLTTASGNGCSVGSKDRSSLHAKKRMKGRRLSVP